MLPGLAEQLDLEEQREQVRFGRLMLICVLGVMSWWVASVHINTPQAFENRRRTKAIHVPQTQAEQTSADSTLASFSLERRRS